MAYGDPILPGRSCAGCTLCCKVLGIEALQKPPNTWCKHCEPAKGCRIYDDRPEECRTFNCSYLTDAHIGEEWKPSRSRMVLRVDGPRTAVHVDPQRPDAWKRDPYYATLKRWAAVLASHRGEIVVHVAHRVHVIFPDRDVDLGIVSEDEIVVTGERVVGGARRLEAIKLHKDDPRAQKFVQQHLKT
jgi:hypothetical protein